MRRRLADRIRCARPGVAALRAAAVLATALAMGVLLALVLAGRAVLTDAAPSQLADSAAAARSAAEVGLFVVGPVAGLLGLAAIVALVLTRPESMAWPGRRQAARGMAAGYVVLAGPAAWVLRPLDWGWLGALAVGAVAAAAWWLLHRAEPAVAGRGWPGPVGRFPPN